MFDENDFDSIYAQYFEKIILSGSALADPSGWAKTETEVELSFPPSPSAETLSAYVIDNRNLIAPQKEILLSLLSEWDHQHYAFDELTITPSISTASLAVLLLLRGQGIKTIVFETPAYYVTIEQAALVGLQTSRIPTYHQDQYLWDWSRIPQARDAPIAVWLTQPRYGLGLNQRPGDIRALLTNLGTNDFLIVDETADQLWPTALSTIDVKSPNVIKIRGYTKPLGLNGLRLSFIIHSEVHRLAFRELLWTSGGALDHYSLAASVHIASDHLLFRSMLFAARARVLAAYRRLALLTSDDRLLLTPMENGYLGSVVLDWSSIKRPYKTVRRALLEHCKSQKLPVTLGSAMMFASDPHREHVRLNYFMPYGDLEFCIKALMQFRSLHIGELF